MKIEVIKHDRTKISAWKKKAVQMLHFETLLNGFFSTWYPCDQFVKAWRKKIYTNAPYAKFALCTESEMSRMNRN